MNKPKAGLLPLYIKLYDDVWPELRPRIEAFSANISSCLAERGIEIVQSPVCRIENEFAEAAALFEREKADAVITLHLAYSPSLESAKALAGLSMPIIVLDTTETYDFSPSQNPDELMFNHGIHGVQDMCNLLCRAGKCFDVEAGHWQNSDVLDRTAARVRGAYAASRFRGMKIGHAGGDFQGMGDFRGDAGQFENDFGHKIVSLVKNEFENIISSVCETEIDDYISGMTARFGSGEIPRAAWETSARTGLAMRAWAAKNGLGAYTVNFNGVTRESGIPVMPFLEASLAMERGTGYAGEGDCLTAALCGALLGICPKTSFAEMFCPDWKGGRVFLSHMGEMNLACASHVKIALKNFPFTDAHDPVTPYGCFAAGKAQIVCLSPFGPKRYRLITSEIEMDDIARVNAFADSTHGWFYPSRPLNDFLSEYSRLGGIHHFCICYGIERAALDSFAKIMGFEHCIV